jgi:tripartite-type tricarboxylate transporter receptor subunit TctC
LTRLLVSSQPSCLKFWGQQAIVENRTGGGGNIAAEFVAHSEADGHTIYVAAFPHAVNRYLYTSLSYDPVTDFAPVTLICLYPLMMVVPNTSPARSVSEFIGYAKTNKLSYASAGYGTSLHLAGELFKRRRHSSFRRRRLNKSSGKSTLIRLRRSQRQRSGTNLNRAVP